MLVNHLHIRILNVSMLPLAFSSKRKHSLKCVTLTCISLCCSYYIVDTYNLLYSIDIKTVYACIIFMGAALMSSLWHTISMHLNGLMHTI